jgi:signal transduction histidine kinase
MGVPGGRVAEPTADERRALVSYMLDTIETERRRIADEIHDEPVQEIAAAVLRLQILRRGLDDPKHDGSLDALGAALDAAIEWLRELMFELRPPGEEGMVAVLQTYLVEAEHRSGIRHRFAGTLAAEPTRPTALLVYRLAQEALINARKHATPTEVTVTVGERDDGYLVVVADDGVGFRADSLPAEGGLSMMRGRAGLVGGTLSIASAPGKGTTVEVWIPEPEEGTLPWRASAS